MGEMIKFKRPNRYKSAEYKYQFLLNYGLWFLNLTCGFTLLFALFTLVKELESYSGNDKTPMLLVLVFMMACCAMVGFIIVLCLLLDLFSNHIKSLNYYNRFQRPIPKLCRFGIHKVLKERGKQNCVKCKQEIE